MPDRSPAQLLALYRAWQRDRRMLRRTARRRSPLPSPARPARGASSHLRRRAGSSATSSPTGRSTARCRRTRARSPPRRPRDATLAFAIPVGTSFGRWLARGPHRGGRCRRRRSIASRWPPDAFTGRRAPTRSGRCARAGGERLQRPIRRQTRGSAVKAETGTHPAPTSSDTITALGHVRIEALASTSVVCLQVELTEQQLVDAGSRPSGPAAGHHRHLGRPDVLIPDRGAELQAEFTAGRSKAREGYSHQGTRSPARHRDRRPSQGQLPAHGAHRAGKPSFVGACGSDGRAAPERSGRRLGRPCRHCDGRLHGARGGGRQRCDRRGQARGRIARVGSGRRGIEPASARGKGEAIPRRRGIQCAGRPINGAEANAREVHQGNRAAIVGPGDPRHFNQATAIGEKEASNVW